MSLSVAQLAKQACDEIAATFAHVDETQVNALVDALIGARRIALYGVGREGLMMRALTMRLYHAGLDAHPVGDMTTPPLAAGDLFMTSAGPGDFSTVSALICTAKAAGAQVAIITAKPDGAATIFADLVVTLPAQTMLNDTGPTASKVLSMGSAYEGAQYVLFEILLLRLRERLGISAEAMRARHTNLE
jgi:6-phospho-3-hexuloisomerase